MINNNREIPSATNEAISRVNPYYALVDGRPLPLVLLEDTESGREARAWFRRWLSVSDKEQIEFCGAMLFWSPNKEKF